MSDQDPIFINTFRRELFGKLGVYLCMSSSYHPQTYGQTEVVNRCLETYLCCMADEKHATCAKWLPLAEWWYNTTYHSTIKMTPFEALYGYQPPIRIPYFSKDLSVDLVDLMLRDKEESVKLLKFYLERSRSRISQVVN